MYAVGMLGSYLTQGVYAVAGPFQPFGGAVDIIVVQQEDGTFKSSPWYVKFGDFQGVIKRQEKIVDISVNDVPADFHMILDGKGEAYFEKEVEADEGTGLMLPDGSTSLESSDGEDETEVVVSTDTAGNEGLLAQEALENAGQEGEMEKVVSMESLVENEMQEERWEIKQESVSGASDESHLKSKNGRLASANSQLSSETAESYNRGCAVEDTCTEGLRNCMNVAMTQDESGEEQEQATVASSDDGIGPESVRVASSMNNQMGLDLGEASNINSSLQATLSKFEIMSIDNSSTFDSSDLEGSSSASQHLFEKSRGNDVCPIAQEESVLHSTTIFAMEGSSLQVVTLSDAEVVENFASDSKSSGEDDSLLVDIWTGDTFEDLKANCDCKGNSNVDASLDEDEVFATFECVTIEREREKRVHSGSDGMNCDVPGELGTDLSWDFESPINQGLGDDVFPPSQSSNVSPDEDSGNADNDSVPSEKEVIADSNATNEMESSGTVATISSPSKWRLWPLLLRWSRLEKASSLSNQALLTAANVAVKSPFTEGILQKNGYLKWQQKTKVRMYVPTSAQLASLNLKDGPNKVTFTFSSVLGRTQVDARIYLWKWNTRIVISDVDGTITKSDVLGQVMPLVGRDWSQYGVTRLFSAIKDNGYEVLFLSARAISQAYLTRRFLLNLKQDGEALPEGPVFISPDGLIPSLYREVIRRAPHEFKISCLEGIRELFPKDVNPFYAGFGNRITDEISYLKVGIPKGKVFIINPKGEVVVNNRIDCKSYTSLHALVDEMFPPMSSHEQEEFNEWNFWKVPLPDIEDELSAKSSKSVKKVGSLKK